MLLTIGEEVWGSETAEAEELGETFEAIHMMIFLVMCLFICQVAVLVWIGNMTERRWKKLQVIALELTAKHVVSL